MRLRTMLLAGAAVLTTACAGTPTGPSVMVLPGSGKSMEQFQADDTRCRQIAAGTMEATKGGEISAQRRYDMAYIQCMYAGGNQVPVPGRSGYGAAPSTTPGSAPAPPPAGTPPPPPPGTPR
jgi:hypothetical protein